MNFTIQYRRTLFTDGVLRTVRNTTDFVWRVQLRSGGGLLSTRSDPELRAADHLPDRFMPMRV